MQGRQINFRHKQENQFDPIGGRSGPHDTRYYMENPEQEFVDYASSSNNEMGVIVLRKEDEVKEDENVKPNATGYNDHEMTAKVEEKVEEESEDEFEEEIEEEEEEDVEYFDSSPQLIRVTISRMALEIPQTFLGTC
ncbi:hypothetical protein Tco_0852944 [Tanacetum coccineum]